MSILSDLCHCNLFAILVSLALLMFIGLLICLFIGLLIGLFIGLLICYSWGSIL